MALSSYKLTSLLQGRKIVIKNETGSTNADLIEEVRSGLADVGDVIAAERQSAGCGRHGKSFASPKGGIYASFCVNNIEYGLSTVICGVAVARVLEKCGCKPAIKWVNDVLLDGRKVCGILAKSVGDGRRAVMGFGINIHESDIPEELRGTATALDAHIGTGFSREEIIADVIREYEKLSGLNARGESGEIIKEYESRMTFLGKKIKVLGTGEILTALGVNADGSLSAINSKGEKVSLSSGEISVRPA